MKETRIFLASDHAGFKLKERIKKYFEEKGSEVHDCGAFFYDKNDDYPDFVVPCAKKVVKTKNSVGIVLGGSGQGEAIAANKIKGVRAVVFYGGDKKILKLSKEHNNANILSLGARFLTEKEAIKAIELWLGAKFSGELRHKRRLGKVERAEKK